MTEQKTMGGEPSFKASIAKGPCWLAKKIDEERGVILMQHFASMDEALQYSGTVENVIEGEEIYYRVEQFFDLEEYRKRKQKYIETAMKELEQLGTTE